MLLAFRQSFKESNLKLENNKKKLDWATDIKKSSAGRKNCMKPHLNLWLLEDWSSAFAEPEIHETFLN